MRVGVFALQGDVREHLRALTSIGVESIEVRNATDLSSIDGLILPGGESTTISKSIDVFSLRKCRIDFITSCKPVFGTCAGMIMLAGWKGDSDFLDPMCGSGTLLIEAAMIARGIPAGIYRKSFAFEKWPDFDEQLFSEIYNADYEKESAVRIFGSDISIQSCAIARANIKNAGLLKAIEVETKDFLELEPPFENGMIVTNPPYGERLKAKSISELYQSMGNVLKQKYLAKMQVVSLH